MDFGFDLNALSYFKLLDIRKGGQQVKRTTGQLLLQISCCSGKPNTVQSLQERETKEISHHLHHSNARADHILAS